MPTQPCPLWGSDALVENWEWGGKAVQSARAGGRYRITRDASDLLVAGDAETAAKLTTWIHTQHEAGDFAPVITEKIVEEVRARRRLRMHEKKMRFFQALSRRRFRPSDTLGLWGLVTQDTKANNAEIGISIEAESDRDTGAFARLLMEEGLLKEEGAGQLRLTSKGFDRLDEVESRGDGDEAFVAMWFGAEMQDVYSSGIYPAIEAAGYRPFRVDQHEHANKIDDEIIAGIRRARFVVADFTCPVFEIGDVAHAESRGGVYYEAGFAQGLGKKVIWSVRADSLNHVHFDTRQFAHIVWERPSDLKIKLQNRIAAII